jgi:hypothetical protein
MSLKQIFNYIVYKFTIFKVTPLDNHVSVFYHNDFEYFFIVRGGGGGGGGFLEDASYVIDDTDSDESVIVE